MPGLRISEQCGGMWRTYNFKAIRIASDVAAISQFPAK